MASRTRKQKKRAVKRRKPRVPKERCAEPGCEEPTWGGYRKCRWHMTLDDVMAAADGRR